MKRLRFHELLLLSEPERTARSVLFPKLVTVIRGENDRGKSCLIKSLYAALGATPRNLHPNWNKLNVILLLYFTIDGAGYRMLKSGKQYSLFDADDKLIGTYTSITRELSPMLAKLFNFRLELMNTKSRRPEQATPAFLYLPFYIDQDRSWIDSWASFEWLQQFSQYRIAIAAFHTGLRPNEYYEAKARKADAEHRRDERRDDRNVLKRLLDRIEDLTKETQFDIDLANYQSEIERLLVECNKLRQDEEHMRDGIVQVENRRALIERQIHITQAAADELGEDFLFASEKLDDEVVCPMCGTGHQNSFAERFGIAADEDRLRSLLLELRDEQKECVVELHQKRQVVSDVSDRVRAITDLLETKLGQVRIRDVLLSEGKKEVRGLLREELDEVNRLVGAADDEIQTAENEMKKLSDRKRVREIRGYYLSRMAQHLEMLHVTELNEDSYKEVHYRIRETGSDLPRALLAFYFAILKTVEKYSTTTLCPIVMDSPKQQDQDPENWRRMLEFIRDNRPPDSQLVVGVVDDLGIDLGGDVVELKDERQLLQRSEYDHVAARLRPFIDASLNQ